MNNNEHDLNESLKNIINSYNFKKKNNNNNDKKLAKKNLIKKYLENDMNIKKIDLNNNKDLNSKVKSEINNINNKLDSFLLNHSKDNSFKESVLVNSNINIIESINTDNDFKSLKGVNIKKFDSKNNKYYNNNFKMNKTKYLNELYSLCEQQIYLFKNNLI